MKVEALGLRFLAETRGFSQIQPVTIIKRWICYKLPNSREVGEL